MTAFRIILITAAICFGIAWFNTGDFLWYGVGCLVSAFILLCTLGLGGDAVEGAAWGGFDFDGGDGGGGD